MNEQLLLFEEPRPTRPGYSLVLAVFPDNDAIKQISDLGESLRKMHGLRGKTLPNGRLHVSLPLPLVLPRALEKAVPSIVQACKVEAARTRPFSIRFDQVMTFRRGRENHPLVLVNNNHGNDDITRLHGTLSAAFAKKTHKIYAPSHPPLRQRVTCTPVGGAGELDRQGDRSGAR